MGPYAGDEETIPERASDRYHVGMLCPSGTPIAADEDDHETADDGNPENGAPGDGVFALANASQQSALGFTFQVEPGTSVHVDAAWGEYFSEKCANATQEDTAPDDSTIIAAASGATPRRSQVRDQIRWNRRPSALGADFRAATSTEPSGKGVLVEHHGISLEVLQRVTRGICVVTLSLVNRRLRKERGHPTEGGMPEDDNIYQVQLSVTSPSPTPSFLARRSGQFIADPEFLVHELLYRSVRQFAVGHGCAVDWLLSDSQRARAGKIWAEWIPATEVFKASSGVSELEGRKCLDLDFLSSASAPDLAVELGAVADSYGRWITVLESRLDAAVSECAPELHQQLRETGLVNIRKCRNIETRIREGVDLIARDGTVFTAFRLANAAMAKSMRLSRPSAPQWRPFQIAFLLLSVPSTAYGDNEYRRTLDLIWFPTGGGKTEAYLGLTAFTLLFRRLCGPTPASGGGTAVITRYTLRLLTMQQLERAARAVMACESLRRRDGRLGTERFAIGLFVGNSATPETVEIAGKVISGEADDEKLLTTLPVAKCPWCGTSLRTSNQKAETDTKRLRTWCPNAGCEFHDDIPIVCVDEELYETPPSMIIGTVDKFAMLPWKPRMARLFGIGRPVRPPSLIIQDELHLIGDALGTMTGLYETAIDALCTEGSIPPKVVGSTATIRRAERQVRAVFLRDVTQFPPSGLDHQDSFFYQEDTTVPGRLYVGVHAQGRSPKHSLARLIGTLAQAAGGITDRKARDHLWTIVAYFNSLRELGGAWVLGLDDVPKYIRAMPKAEGARIRNVNQITELTSVLPTTEIPRVLENLARGLENDDDLDHEPIDLLLCTNMISVGVDIDRLGLMIVNGQPKTTAEYIQASSRVGRPTGAAGLVVALYNWTRPRDRSHYERFRAYHGSFYRNVEATSVTPFSSRARDRALHAVLIALLRSRIPQLRDSPLKIDSEVLLELRDTAVQEIVDRALAVSESEPCASDVRGALEEILTQIAAVARAEGAWSSYEQGAKFAVMRPPNSLVTKGSYETPQSMRDVDAPSLVSLRTETAQ